MDRTDGRLRAREEEGGTTVVWVGQLHGNWSLSRDEKPAQEGPRGKTAGCWPTSSLGRARRISKAGRLLDIFIDQGSLGWRCMFGAISIEMGIEDTRVCEIQGSHRMTARTEEH